MDRIKHLLKGAVAGLRNDRTQIERLETSIHEARNANPEELKDHPLRNPVQVSLSDTELDTVTWAIATANQQQDRLPFYLHSVLLIALWSAFESYLQSILGQIYLQNNSELASDKLVSIRELVEHSGTVTDFLIEKELDAFGHLSLDKMINYIKGRLKYDFSGPELALLKELYLLRNIAAHNSGFIRPSQQSLLPTLIKVHQNQIEIPEKYLKEAIQKTTAIVKRMDTYMVRKWSVPKSRDALFEEELPSLSDEETGLSIS